MEASPLTQQTRPETFQPKIVQLYQTLFLVRIMNEMADICLFLSYTFFIQ